MRAIVGALLVSSGVLVVSSATLLEKTSKYSGFFIQLRLDVFLFLPQRREEGKGRVALMRRLF